MEWTDIIICGNCLEVMKDIPDHSVDMILCDLPYGVTANNPWDAIIPFESLWKAYDRIIKERGAIVLTASQPFTSLLVASNLKMFKYCWVWDKVNRVSGHLNVKKQPLRVTEDVVVFYKKQPTYHPQMVPGEPYTTRSRGRKSTNYGAQKDGVLTINEGWYYPRNLIAIPADERGTVGRIHPTQKPIDLFAYLIKTYTDEGDLVLDNCVGSGTTCVACRDLNRHFIGIDIEERYCEMARNRITCPRTIS
jgi:site-specific DNA-methyltransferase (adenine-specific)